MGAARGRTSRLAPVLVAAALAASAASCTGGSDTATPSPRPDAATTPSRTTEPAPERYEGTVDGFYRVPDPLPPGRPGDLIRTQPVASGDGTATVRVMYHSTDATGADRAVTGIVTHPVGPAPEGGWPVISTAHGTTGIASRCAPSRSGDDAPAWGIEGVRVATDYIGLGPEGELHAYLDKVDEGHAVIDIVRAAQHLPDAHAGDRWVAIGHSQGGHGALAAHELATAYAPELQLDATVALAPAALLDRVYGGIDPIVTAILTMMGVYGGQAEHPDVDLADLFTPEALAVSSVFETGCLGEITDALIPVAIHGAFTADPRRTEPARSLLLANDVGHHAVDGVPLLLASGTADDRVVIERFRDLVARVCATGQRTEVHVVVDATHDSIIGATGGEVTEFLERALAGRPTTDSCERATRRVPS